MNLLFPFASAHGPCFIRLPLSSPMNFLPSRFPPPPSCWWREWQRSLEGTWHPPGANPPQLFTPQLFKLRCPLNLHLTQPRTVKGKVRSVWPALICSSMTHICIQLSWLQIICGWAKNMAYSVTHTEIHCAPSFKWTICTNSHFIQLL